MLPLIALATTAAAFGGGLIALKFRDQLHIVLGFSAGAVLGVAFFDLLPEVIELGETFPFGLEPLTLVAIAFFSYLLLDRIFFPHCHGGDHCHSSSHRGQVVASGLSFHSFLDGLAVGVAFQASLALGAAVTLAVLAHGFADGINTVGMITKHGGSKKDGLKWLTLSALAPALGILVGSVFIIGEAALGPILAVFAGFFIYLGASDLLPESHHNHSTLWTTVATLAGAGLVFLIANLLTI